MVYGDRGYWGCDGVIVCGSREMRAKRQVVEGVISQIKLFNAGSGRCTFKVGTGGEGSGVLPKSL